ncbi:putative snRNP and snoRNP protein [Lepidopterella palustris CBS 459.81]|uniref:H/ACA ribonucleoprotein complex subunit 2 n=1 Tax=Lepidopterella palustris CBS 459.81 TaxID=1314670 RepID=A0A8E2EEX2_9PEZI|nr:putative snRNP and snoRNP protein [Lepidopterella palustris CBS 459.81]
MSQDTSTAWPVADQALSQDILDLVQQASHRRLFKKGADEAMETLNRGITEIVVLAADTAPIFQLAILLHLPLPIDDKNVSYIYLLSKIALGRACGVSRALMAVSITINEASGLFNWIRSLKDKVERPMV